MFFIFTLILIATVGFINRHLLKKANAKIWQIKSLDRLAGFLPYSIVVFALIWGAGTLSGILWIKLSGATVTGIMLILNVVLLMTLPFSYGTLLLTRIFSGKPVIKSKDVDSSRRVFLKTAAAAAPVMALGSAGKGLAASFSQTEFPQVNMQFENLPDALEGFKILHLSDLHLGYYFGLDHLERTLMDAEKYQPHMLVVTGDIADDLSVMTDAMKLIGQFKAPFSHYVTVGNHEYFRGINEAIKQINAGPVPLLLNEHDSIDVYNSKLVIGGADDPVRMRSGISGFLDNAAEKTFKNAPQGDFRILLSHRPRALDIAEKYNVDLTLSGHTHGGQIGLAGRSIWEIVNENGYLWGAYQKGNSQLYTSAGMGHWFPFRLNCPLEAPVITLTKKA